MQYTVLERLYSFEQQKHHVRARYRGREEITQIEVRPGDRETTRRSKGPKQYEDKKPPKEEREPIAEDEGLSETAAAMHRALDTATLKRVTNIGGIIEGTKRYGLRVMEVFFADACLTEEDQARLYRWAIENGWVVVEVGAA